MTVAELRLYAQDLLARRGGACACENGRRDPVAVVRGALVLTVCRSCGGYTSPREV